MQDTEATIITSFLSKSEAVADFKRGTFRAKGDTLEIYPSDQNEKAIRVEFWGDEIEKVTQKQQLLHLFFQKVKL